MLIFNGYKLTAIIMDLYKTFLIKNCKFFLLFILSPFLISCFEILEEVDMNTDGSGEMTMTINLSQSKNKIASIMLLDSINGYKVPSKKDIQQDINGLSTKLKNIAGISNVKTTTDFTNYIVSVSFSFSDVSVLNKASKDIFAAYKMKVEETPVYSYNKASKTFNYDYKNGNKEAYNKLKAADKEVFKNATYTQIYRFTSTIEKSNNAQAKISKSKKAIMQKSLILDLINNKVNISNQIKLN